MINGAHVIIYSKDADADRALLRDVFKLPNIDVGHGWLIFGLPPAEVAVHPGDENDSHALYFMCADVKKLIADLKTKKIPYSPVSEQPWGLLTQMTLPGGGKLGIYQPKHKRPPKVG